MADSRAASRNPMGASGDAAANGNGRYDGDVRALWEGRTRLVLTPTAAPSILGLMGFAGATFMIASNLAGWWGNTTTDPAILAPFALFFGGLAQLVAGVFGYRARDGLATAAHGTWGAFWLAFGMFQFAIVGGLLPASAATSRAFGFWFIVLCVTTTFYALAALAKSIGLFTVLLTLAAGSGLFAAGFIGGYHVSGYHQVVMAGGWVLVASAAAAFYTAGAMLLRESANGRTILPLGEYNVRGNVPSMKSMEPIEYELGMPGAKLGQ